MTTTSGQLAGAPASTVTVLLPTHNGMPHLQQAVDSILGQTLKDLTLLILDDGSTDGTPQYLSSLADPRVRVQRIPHSGLGAALNVGVDLCNTEFIGRMDADDIALPHRLERQLAFLRANDGVGVLGTHFAYCTSPASTGFVPPLACDHDGIKQALLRMEHALCHGTLLCRAACLRRIGGYRVTGAGQDWDLFLRLADVCRLANLKDVLYLYRLHRGSINAVQANHVRLQRSYACYCARQRARGLEEHSYDWFVATTQMSITARASRWFDIVAYEQYRRGIADVLCAHPVKGYARLILAATLSPSRVAGRMRRLLRVAGGTQHVSNRPALWPPGPQRSEARPHSEPSSACVDSREEH